MFAERWKRTLLAVAAALLGFIALGSWAFASPVGSSPDDDYHSVSIWCSWGNRDDLCEPGEQENSRVVSTELISALTCYVRDPNATATCSLETEVVDTKRGDFTGDYPPVYYGVMGAFASENVTQSTILVRLANAAIFIGFTSALAVSLGRGRRGPLFWSMVIGMVPLGVFLVPSMNPSSWAILSGLTVWLAISGYFTAETRSQRLSLAVLSVLGALLGGGARGDAAIYLLIAAGLAAILTYEGTKRWWQRTWLPAVVSVLGVLFFLSTRSAQGYASSGLDQLQEISSAAEGSNGYSAPISPVNLILRNLMNIPSLWAGSLGTWGIGWYEWQLPQTIPVIMVGAFSALAFMGLRAMNVRKGIALALLFTALLLIPSYIMFGLQVTVGGHVQPRYLLPLVLMSIGIALYGVKRDDLGLSRLQATVLLAGVTVANSLAMFWTLRRYLTGVDYSGLGLNRNVQWWWITPLHSFWVSPMLLWGVGTLTFGAAVWCGYLLMRGGSKTGAEMSEREVTSVS